MPTTEPDDPNSPAAKAGAQRAKIAAANPGLTVAGRVNRPAPPPGRGPGGAGPTGASVGGVVPPRAGGLPIGSYTMLTGDPAKGAVPPGEYNVLESLMGEWESLVGYSVEPSTAQLLQMANAGLETLADFGKFMATQPNAEAVISAMPWAKYGLTKDEYASAASTFGTEYKKITGQDISPDALAQAFANPLDPTGGLLNQAQYAQQLMNDSAIQKQYGWVKYGLDFSAWTQQKLSMRTAFGRDINDSEAATILQYSKANSGSNMAVTAKQSGQQAQQPAAVGGSVVR